MFGPSKAVSSATAEAAACQQGSDLGHILMDFT